MSAFGSSNGELFSPYVPDDFDEFWSEVKSDADAVPLYFWRERTTLRSPSGHLIDRVEFNGGDGAKLEGWIAYPERALRARSFLWIPPYGRESLLPNEYGTREGMTSMSLNLHGLGAFHEEKYQVSRGYFGEGVLDPRTWVFRRLIQHVLIAIRVLQAQGEVDEDRISAMGMSQGAGLAIWAGALSPIVRAVAADMPFLGEMRSALTQSAYRYPLKEIVDVMENEPLGRERTLHTLSYYDTLNLATRCAVPTQISLGLKDPACRPDTVRAIYQALRADSKRLIEYVGGHDWDPAMVANNAEWIQAEVS